MNFKNNKNAKKAAADAAIQFVKQDMVIGLGTGSTAAYFIEALGKLKNEGLKFTAVATSNASYDLAKSLGIHMIDIDSITSLDLVVDGADEIDSHKQMIKGGGAALFREKIVANMAKEMIVIVDESKVVDYLGNFPLSIEITPFAFKATMQQIERYGSSATLRLTSDGLTLKTDNGNYIVDLKLHYPCENPEIMNVKLKLIPGVCETGLFINMAGRVIIGYVDGRVKIC